MWIEEVKASFAAQGRRMADQMNQGALTGYLDACQNWADNRGAGAKPAIPRAVEAVIAFEPTFKLELIETDRPLTAVKAEDFLPTYGTDVGAVGGLVGGPIVGAPGKFYAAAGTNPYAGQITVVGGVTYEYCQPTPFGGFWVRDDAA